MNESLKYSPAPETISALRAFENHSINHFHRQQRRKLLPRLYMYIHPPSNQGTFRLLIAASDARIYRHQRWPSSSSLINQYVARNSTRHHHSHTFSHSPHCVYLQHHLFGFLVPFPIIHLSRNIKKKFPRIYPHLLLCIGGLNLQGSLVACASHPLSCTLTLSAARERERGKRVEPLSPLSRAPGVGWRRGRGEREEGRVNFYFWNVGHP